MVRIEKSNRNNSEKKKLMSEFSLTEEQISHFLHMNNNNYENTRSYLRDYMRREQRNSGNTEQLKPTKKIYRYLNGLLIEEKFYDYEQYEDLRDLNNNSIDSSIFNVQADHVDVEIVEMNRMYKKSIPSEIAYKEAECKLYFKFEKKIILLKTDGKLKIEEINIYLNEILGTKNKRLHSTNIEQYEHIGDINKTNLVFQ